MQNSFDVYNEHGFGHGKQLKHGDHGCAQMARPNTLMMTYMVLFSHRTVQLPAPRQRGIMVHKGKAVQQKQKKITKAGHCTNIAAKLNDCKGWRSRNNERYLIITDIAVQQKENTSTATTMVSNSQ